MHQDPDPDFLYRIRGSGSKKKWTGSALDPTCLAISVSEPEKIGNCLG